MTQKFVVSFIYSVSLKQPVAKVTSCILATGCKLRTIFTSSNCCFSFIPPAPHRLHCNCHHYYYHPITSSPQSSSLSLFSCSEKPLIFFFCHISCELPWDQGWQVKAIKFHWKRGNIYLGGHFDSKEIQSPCCQDLRGEHIYISVRQQEMQNANRSKK